MSRQIEYNDTGVNWLGQIPSTWESKRIKMLTRVKRGASPRPIDNPIYFDEEGEFAWVRIADVTASERYLESTTQRLSELGSSLSVKRYPDDFFLSIAGTVGKPIITKIECCIHDGFVYFPDLKINPEFLYYIFSTGLPYLGLGKMGTQLNLNTDTVGDIYIPIPVEQEIEMIVSYLDERTAEIDNLISKKQKLIECLKEERMAIINHAVTKGINTNAEMKESGIDWLGEIPKHWGIKKLRYLGTCQNGITKSGEKFGKGFPFMSYGVVYNNEVITENLEELVESTNEDHITYSIKEGDVFFTRTSETIEEIGIASTCFKTIPNSAFSGFLIRVRLNEKIFKGFSKYYFRCTLLRKFFVSEMNIVTRASLSQDLLKNLPILLPPLKEQYEIFEFLETRTKYIDNTINNIEQEIDLLKEYRTSLINEVVSGKIIIN